MEWATRRDIRIDRTASVWLIRSKIDADAKIRYVDDSEIEALTRSGIHTFDAEHALYRHSLADDMTKYGELCTFQTLIREFGLEGDDALVCLGTIVHAGDIGHRRGIFEPREGFGLWAVMRGLALTVSDDAVRAAAAIPIWDAMYAYCRADLEGPKHE